MAEASGWDIWTQITLFLNGLRCMCEKLHDDKEKLYQEFGHYTFVPPIFTLHCMIF